MNKHLFLVEPHADVRETLSTLLEHYGYQVKAFQQGGDALAAALEKRPDAVVTELSLRDMTGHYLCRKLRELPDMGDCKIIAMTASPHLRSEATDRCFDNVLVKPAEIADLIDTIST